MIATARKWHRLTTRQRWLVVEATLALAFASLAIALVPFKRVASLARATASGDDMPQEQTIRAVRWAILASARRVPWRAKCLEQAFAAHWMLRRRSIAAVIHYGVAQAPGQLAAHAWVRAGQNDVVGCENAAEFAEVAHFPAGPSAGSRTVPDRHQDHAR